MQTNCRQNFRRKKTHCNGGDVTASSSVLHDANPRCKCFNVLLDLRNWPMKLPRYSWTSEKEEKQVPHCRWTNNMSVTKTWKCREDVKHSDSRFHIRSQPGLWPYVDESPVNWETSLSASAHHSAVGITPHFQMSRGSQEAATFTQTLRPFSRFS